VPDLTIDVRHGGEKSIFYKVWNLSTWKEEDFLSSSSPNLREGL